MTIPTPIQTAALPSEQDGSGSSSSSNNIRRNWVHVATPKNKQWTTAMDGADKLKLTSADLPTPRDGEVLVQIRAVSLNYRDIQVCQGAFNSYNTQARQQDLVPCSDMCGVVLAYPSTSTTPRFPVGTRVLAIYLQSHLRGEPDEADLGSALGLPLPGVLARYRCFPAASLVAVPAYLSDAEASCLPLAAATAWTALNWLRPLSPSVGGVVVGGKSTTHQQQVKDGGGGASKTTVLVQGTTAVALAGLQIAKAAGCRALLTAATDDFAKRAKEQLQADETVNYQTHWAWEGDVLDATGGRGADVIFETGDGARAAAGGSARTLRKSFKCVAFGGVINCIGSLSSGRTDDDDGDNGGGGDDGKTPELHRLNVNALALARNVTIKGVLNGGRDRLEEALAFYEEHRIKPVVDKTYAFAEAKEAMAYVKQGKHFGKVVITIEDGTNEKDGTNDEDADDGEDK